MWELAELSVIKQEWLQLNKLGYFSFILALTIMLGQKLS